MHMNAHSGIVCHNNKEWTSFGKCIARKCIVNLPNGHI